MPTRNHGDRRASLQRLFHDLTPLPLRTVSAFGGSFGNQHLRASRSSHSPSMSGLRPVRKTVLTERLRLIVGQFDCTGGHLADR